MNEMRQIKRKKPRQPQNIFAHSAAPPCPALHVVRHYHDIYAAISACAPHRRYFPLLPLIRFRRSRDVWLQFRPISPNDPPQIFYSPNFTSIEFHTKPTRQTDSPAGIFWPSASRCLSPRSPTALPPTTRFAAVHCPLTPSPTLPPLFLPRHVQIFRIFNISSLPPCPRYFIPCPTPHIP